jgi:glycosyltransferase involved in cell wall biosynthesis
MSIQGARPLRPGPSVLASEGAPALEPEVSVVIPFLNEERNIDPLMDELFDALRSLGRSFEVVAVDDGSSDATFACLMRVAGREPLLRVIRLRRNFGQTAAMSAGIDAALGQVIVPMDGDLQNDPADISRLLAKLEGKLPENGQSSPERYDVVSGWRKNRNDRQLGRKLPSRVANWLISLISGVRLHDYGCSLKAYRREVLKGVRLYGEMHRFIPIYASWQGARVAELVVNHRARRHGHSNYGLGRIGKVLLDLMVVKFLASYATKPMYLFGGFGLLSLALSAGAVLWALIYKLLDLKDFVETPLPLLAVLFALVGILSVLMGLLAELVIRTYYEAQNKRPYLIAEEISGLELSSSLSASSSQQPQSAATQGG